MNIKCVWLTVLNSIFLHGAGLTPRGVQIWFQNKRAKDRFIEANALKYMAKQEQTALKESSQQLLLQQHTQDLPFFSQSWNPLYPTDQSMVHSPERTLPPPTLAPRMRTQPPSISSQPPLPSASQLLSPTNLSPTSAFLPSVLSSALPSSSSSPSAFNSPLSFPWASPSHNHLPSSMDLTNLLASIYSTQSFPPPSPSIPVAPTLQQSNSSSPVCAWRGEIVVGSIVTKLISQISNGPNVPQIYSCALSVPLVCLSSSNECIAYA